MKTSFVHRYRLAVNNYEHFIKEHRPERLGEDQPPLLPLTLDDLLQYYDHKFQLCNYRTTRNYVSSLLHHPEHGAEWKRDIFESYLAEEKRNQMREAERNGESNIQNSGVLRPLQRSSRFFTYVPAAVVPEKGQIYDNNSECHVIQGVNRGDTINLFFFVLMRTVSGYHLLLLSLTNGATTFFFPWNIF